jgi:hypothetical protein
MTPCACAAASASAICFAMGSASSNGICSAANALRQSHPAFANLRGNFVDAEAGTGCEGQVWRDYTGGAAASARLLLSTSRSSGTP